MILKKIAFYKIFIDPLVLPANFNPGRSPHSVRATHTDHPSIGGSVREGRSSALAATTIINTHANVGVVELVVDLSTSVALFVSLFSAFPPFFATFHVIGIFSQTSRLGPTELPTDRTDG